MACQVGICVQLLQNIRVVLGLSNAVQITSCKAECLSNALQPSMAHTSMVPALRENGVACRCSLFHPFMFMIMLCTV